MRLASAIKTLLVPSGRMPRIIRWGVFKGLKMELDFSCQFQVYVGTFERETYSWLRRLSQGIRTGVDIGAAEGEYTLFLLAKSGANKVLAFEPSESSLTRLRTNLSLNNLTDDPRLEVSEKLVGSRLDNSVTTLDSRASAIRTPCLVKMDVDGAEVNIL